LARAREWIQAADSVLTLARRPIALDRDPDNREGKAINRIIQGTAADIFNRAVLRVDAAIEREGLDAAVAFLLFDELWVECDPSAVPRVVELLRRERGGAALPLEVEVPVRIEEEPAPALPLVADGTPGDGEEVSSLEAADSPTSSQSPPALEPAP